MHSQWSRRMTRDEARRHYEQRLAQFLRENQSVRAPAIVFIGDSLTEGSRFAEAFAGRVVLNRGINSDRLEWERDRGIVHRLDAEVFASKPTHIFLMAGINDLGEAPGDVDTPAANYARVVSGLRERYSGVPVFVQSLLPARGIYRHLNDSIVKLNEKLRSLATYVDLHRLFVDEKGELRAEYSRDGLHLTKKGYDVWENAVAGLADFGAHRPRFLSRFGL
jgi:lysophospholipase L1-like esterase